MDVFILSVVQGTHKKFIRKFGLFLDTFGLVTELRRIGFGDLNKKLISLDYLLSLVHSDGLNKLVYPIDDVFNKASKINLDRKQVKKKF